MGAAADRAVLVTGGAKRLGAIIARHLAREGWQVLIHYNSSGEDAAALTRELTANGGTAQIFQADLADPAAAKDLIAAAAKAAPLAALVNSASLFEYDSAADFTPDGLDAHLQVNLAAPVLLAREFAATLPAGREGCVVNILDQKLWNLNPDFFTYTLSKYALLGATKTLAQALAPQVRVNGVAPGLTLPSGGQTEAEFAEVAGKYNLRRQPIDPDMVAGAVSFLLTNSAMTGEILRADNGQHLVSSDHDIMFNRRNHP